MKYTLTITVEIDSDSTDPNAVRDEVMEYLGCLVDTDSMETAIKVDVTAR